MKKVLITAGSVYGSIDDNKLVSNRARGVWAIKFAEYLEAWEYRVTLLVPDLLPDPLGRKNEHNVIRSGPGIQVLHHKGFEDYHYKCLMLAQSHDAMVAAAAVVNWIPAEPIPGKMPTKGYKPGDIISIPFRLAPRVIDEMKVQNPNLTLIGCKMLSGAGHEDLIEAAYHTVLSARCNVVVANDLSHLRDKFLVHQDRTVVSFRNDFDGLFRALRDIIEDEHYTTDWLQTNYPVTAPNEAVDWTLNQYRGRFIQRAEDSDHVFGALFIPTGSTALGLVTPREKNKMFSVKDLVVIKNIHGTVIQVHGPSKATLNAPLLARVSQKYPKARAVLHLHEQLSGVPVVPYAPPGTVRDNDREIPGPVFNIEGHGFVACLDQNGDIFKVGNPALLTP